MIRTKRGAGALELIGGLLIVIIIVFISWKFISKTDDGTKTTLQSIKEKACLTNGGKCVPIASGVSCTGGQQNISYLVACPNVYDNDGKPTTVQQDCCLLDPAAKSAVSACQGQGGTCEAGVARTVAGQQVVDCMNNRVKVNVDCPSSSTPQVCCKAPAAP